MLEDFHMDGYKGASWDWSIFPLYEAAELLSDGCIYAWHYTCCHCCNASGWSTVMVSAKPAHGFMEKLQELCASPPLCENKQRCPMFKTGMGCRSLAALGNRAKNGQPGEFEDPTVNSKWGQLVWSSVILLSKQRLILKQLHATAKALPVTVKDSVKSSVFLPSVLTLNLFHAQTAFGWHKPRTLHKHHRYIKRVSCHHKKLASEGKKHHCCNSLL